MKIMYGYAFAEHKYPGSPEWRIHLIDDRSFAVRPVEGGDLVWMHDQGYCIQMPDGSIIPCGSDIVTAAEAPAADILSAGGVEIIPIRGFHDKMPVLGFRFGDIAYITDMSSIPEGELSKLKGLKHLTLNTVSYHPHHSHFSLSEAVEMAGRIGAEHTWLTHLSHTFPSHARFDSELPDGISPAYDGLVITD